LADGEDNGNEEWIAVTGILEEVCGIGVEHRQADELLGYFWPRGDDEANQILALEDTKEAFL
jgi:hypothetical protein